MTVTWPDDVDGVLASDLTAAVAYVTPAGGAVVTAVAPIGLRDREAGTVSFTTSLGFGRKLERIRKEPRVALAYHAREHGFSNLPLYVLVQGRASFSLDPDQDYLETVIRPQSSRFLGPPREGRFWDRWLREYYRDRVPVHVAVERVVVWRDLRCQGAPEIHGAGLPEAPPAPQTPPKGGTEPRVDTARAARRLGRLPHLLAGFVGADGHPVIVPVAVGEGGPGGIALDDPAGLLPEGGRRAGLLAHDYRPKLIGLAAQQHTGWLEAGGGRTVYAPHTETRFKAPANKTLLLLANGLLAKRGLKKARREGRDDRLRAAT